jgi:hypothetical protein
LQEEEPFGGGEDDVVVEEERIAEHVEHVAVSSWLRSGGSEEGQQTR